MKYSEEKELVYAFSKQYSTKTGHRYLITWGRDQKLMRKLLECYPADQIQKAMEQYFSEEHKFYSIVYMLSNFNVLIQKVSRNTPIKRMINPDEERFL